MAAIVEAAVIVVVVEVAIVLMAVVVMAVVVVAEVVVLVVSLRIMQSRHGFKDNLPSHTHFAATDKRILSDSSQRRSKWPRYFPIAVLFCNFYLSLFGA